MKSSAKYEREVEKLRERKTYHFNRNEFQQCDTLTRKIIETWAVYHKAAEREKQNAG